MSEVSPVSQSPALTKAHELVLGALGARQSLHAMASQEISDPLVIHEALVRARQVTDSLELALVHGLNLKRAAEARLAAAKAAIEDAELSSFSHVRKTEFASAKEKDVQYRMHTLEEQREYRIAMDECAQVRTIVETLKILHRGADDTRKDYYERLRAITLTRPLERG